MDQQSETRSLPRSILVTSHTKTCCCQLFTGVIELSIIHRCDGTVNHSQVWQSWVGKDLDGGAVPQSLLPGTEKTWDDCLWKVWGCSIIYWCNKCQGWWDYKQNRILLSEKSRITLKITTFFSVRQKMSIHFKAKNTY